ncbi:MAG TPA: UDP-N-acetylmuramate--L-alanine ligase [Armatimonadota bacterium]
MLSSKPSDLAQQYQHVHFIGIGGVSMSALACTLRSWGMRVSGSDKAESPALATLRAQGIETRVPQAAGNLGDADLVIYTTAILPDNPELVQAQSEGRELWHRSRLLAALMTDKRRIAIAGTHGKSSTTCMVATVLAELGQDPTLFVGGISGNFHSNYHLGSGNLAVFEACESDGSFRAYPGCSQVITSIEPDHLDQHGTVENLIQAFRDFAAGADPEGFVAHAFAPPLVGEVAACSPARTVSYGLDPAADYSAADIERFNGGLRFVPVIRGRRLAPATLPVIGDHNLRNALAALTVATELGFDPAEAAQALAAYKGVGRRFESLGTMSGCDVIDDYAHHPTEIRATLAAARKHYGQRIIAIFQPHLYSRTRDLLDEFGSAFGDADVVILADIYAARELPCDDISSHILYELVRERNPEKTVVYLPSFEAIVQYVRDHAQVGDMILTMGAGDIRQVGETLAHDQLPAAP